MGVQNQFNALFDTAFDIVRQRDIQAGQGMQVAEEQVGDLTMQIMGVLADDERGELTEPLREQSARFRQLQADNMTPQQQALVGTLGQVFDIFMGEDQGVDQAAAAPPQAAVAQPPEAAPEERFNIIVKLVEDGLNVETLRACQMPKTAMMKTAYYNIHRVGRAQRTELNRSWENFLGWIDDVSQRMQAGEYGGINNIGYIGGGERGFQLGENMEQAKKILTAPCWSFASFGCDHENPQTCRVNADALYTLFGNDAMMGGVPGAFGRTLEARIERVPGFRDKLTPEAEAYLRANEAEINELLTRYFDVVGQINFEEGVAANISPAVLEQLKQVQKDVMELYLRLNGFEIADPGEETPYSISMYGDNNQLVNWVHWGLNIDDGHGTVHCFETIPDKGIEHRVGFFAEHHPSTETKTTYTIPLRSLNEAQRDLVNEATPWLSAP